MDHCAEPIRRVLGELSGVLENHLASQYLTKQGADTGKPLDAPPRGAKAVGSRLFMGKSSVERS
jgi:hypothetical protein